MLIAKLWKPKIKLALCLGFLSPEALVLNICGGFALFSIFVLQILKSVDCNTRLMLMAKFWKLRVKLVLHICFLFPKASVLNTSSVLALFLIFIIVWLYFQSLYWFSSVFNTCNNLALFIILVIVICFQYLE